MLEVDPAAAHRRVDVAAGDGLDDLVVLGERQSPEDRILPRPCGGGQPAGELGVAVQIASSVPTTMMSVSLPQPLTSASWNSRVAASAPSESSSRIA